MNFFKKHYHFFAVLILLFVVNLTLFGPFYLKHLLPVPGNLLVSFYFPWSTGGFLGFDPWTTYKDQNAADAIRQMIPWKSFVINQLKSGQLPLWNPYSFSGSPLLANLQSSVFWPGVIFFLLLPIKMAWTLEVMITPFILALGFYLFFRSEKLSFPSSLMGALFAANLSYISIWQEILVVAQSIIVLPFILWLANISPKHQRLTGFLIPLLLAFSIFGGHVQTSLYVFTITLGFLFVKKWQFQKIFLTFLFGISLASIQLVPTVELYLFSSRDGPSTANLFPTFILPLKHFVTVIIPDFFGNPATGNYWSRHYGEFQVYSGLVCLIFATVGLIKQQSKKSVRFFTIIGVVGLIFSSTPAAFIFQWLHVPILSTSMPARTTFLLQIAFAIIGAYGLEHFWSKKNRMREYLLSLSFILLCFLGALIWTRFLGFGFAKIAIRNTAIPLGIFSVTSLVIFVSVLHPKFKKLSLAILFCLAVYEYGLFFNKYQPFSRSEFFFPNHPILTALQNLKGIDRFSGNGVNHLEKNFSVYYGLYNPEGYDPLYLSRYGEFMWTGFKGKSQSVPRSDADLNIDPRSDREIFLANRVKDITGVKYQLHRDAINRWDKGKFPPGDYNLIWHESIWQIYERKSALPRVALFGGFEKKFSDKDILTTLYDPKFSYSKKILLETTPHPLPIDDEQGEVKTMLYEPNRIILLANIITSKILFLSDNYYPGWKVFIDGREGSILRANYTFRAVSLPPGNHKVEFIYDPLSVKIGLSLSLLSLVSLCLLNLKK